MGKTTLISTAPRPIYVIASDPLNKLDSAGTGPEGMEGIFFDGCNAERGDVLESQFDKCHQEAKRGVAAGEYKTVVWDTLTSFAMLMIQWELEQSDKNGKGSDSRRATERYNSTITSAILRLAKLPCHVLVLAHDYPSGPGKIEGQMDKRGVGIVPNIYGSIRGWVSGQFRDVGYLTTTVKGTAGSPRVIKWSVDGCYGIGSNSRPGVEDSPADVTEFLEWRRDRPAPAKR